eukprot:4013351-Pleurochrysis_carterae.AAC.1
MPARAWSPRQAAAEGLLAADGLVRARDLARSCGLAGVCVEWGGGACAPVCVGSRVRGQSCAWAV